MAKYLNNLIMEGMRGAIGKQFVLKKYKSGTFLAKFPDMSKVVPTTKQLAAKQKFKEAVAYAKEQLITPQKHNQLIKRTPSGKNPHHYAISEFMKTK